MTAPVDSEEPRSLLGVTIRRSITVGRAGLVYGIGVSTFLTIALSFSSRAGFASGIPIFIPIFGTVASMGGLTVFTSDRLKGVLEYLMAYGISPRRLFANILIASLASLSIMLAVALGISTSVLLIKGFASDIFFQLIAVYSIPMSYASAAFVGIIGMYWTALSSPRQGLNSPIGVAPLLGILPSIATLGAAVAFGALTGDATTFVAITSISVSLVAAFVLILLGMIGRLLRRERLLSPA